jgi:hypothetical protein
MTESAKQAWSDVGEKFTSWGRQVADRYEKDGPADAAATAESQRELQRAARELVDQLSRGVAALGGTLRDDRANKELMQAVSAIGDAISATVNEATEGLRSGGASGGDKPSENG